MMRITITNLDTRSGLARRVIQRAAGSVQIGRVNESKAKRTARRLRRIQLDRARLRAMLEAD